MQGLEKERGEQYLEFVEQLEGSTSRIRRGPNLADTNRKLTDKGAWDIMEISPTIRRGQWTRVIKR